jgi:hypothetical protein
VKGTVCLTVSDADMIESKVLALLSRIHVQARDIVDLFLFQDTFRPGSDQRLKTKRSQLKMDPAFVERALARLHKNRVLHVRAVDRVIEEQVDETVAANLKEAGGGGMVVDTVFSLVTRLLNAGEDPPS